MQKKTVKKEFTSLTELRKWVESESVTFPPIMPTEKRERQKESCTNYDFKKNQCMCTNSVVFTQQCENIGSCEYYKEKRFPIYIVPKYVNKSKKCPCCNNGTKKEFDYLPAGWLPSNDPEIVPAPAVRMHQTG